MNNVEKRPLISIVVASYNYEDLIREAFDSILAQTYDHYEIVVVDDGSTDNSLEVIREYMAKTDKMKLYTHHGNANLGLPATVKMGVTVAQGEYVAFLECDDLWTPDHLQRKVEMINSDDNVNVVANGIELFGDKKSVEARIPYLQEIENKYLHRGKNTIDLLEIGRLNVIATFSSVLVSKKVLAVLNYDTPIPAWIDFWLYRQIFNMGESVYYVPEKITRWRQHANSFNGLVQNKYNEKSADNFFHLGNRMMGILSEESDLYYLTKNSFHEKITYRMASDSLHYALQKIQDKKKRRKLQEKFFWYRVVQFWNNDGYGKDERTDYDRLALGLKESGKKNILVLFHELSQTGAPRAGMLLVRALKDQGANVKVLAPMLSPKGSNILSEMQSMGLDVIVDPLLRIRLYGGDEALFRYLNGFDEIVFNTLVSVIMGKFMGKCHSKKIGWLHEGWLSYDVLSDQGIDASLNMMDEVYAVGPYSRSFAMKHLINEKKDVGIFLYGIEDEARQAPRTDDNGKVKMLVAGSVDKRKGIYTLLKSMEYLPQAIKETLHIGLAGVMHEEELRKGIEEEKSGCIEYLGAKSHDDLMSCMEGTDVLLCPSLDDPMPIVCTEAMMMGKVVVASTKTGTASLIKDGENGFIVKAGDAKALADTIVRVCAMRNRFEDIGKEARKIYEENFSLPIFKKNVKRVFLDS